MEAPAPAPQPPRNAPPRLTRGMHPPPSLRPLPPAAPQELGEVMAAKTQPADDAPKLGQVRKVVQTTIDVAEASNGSCSVLKITTRDRPGLLVDIVRVLKDINLNVVSAEIDTEGALAKDEVRSRGAPRGLWVGKGAGALVAPV